MKFCKEKNIWLLLILTSFLLFSCSPDENEVSDLKDFIPSNTSYLIQSSDFTGFFEKIDSLNFFTNNPDIFGNSGFAHLQNLNKLSGFKDALVAFVEKDGGIDNYLLVTRDSLLINTDSIQNKSRETLKYENFEIQKISAGEAITYITNKDDVFFASDSQSLLESVMKPEFKRISSEGFEMAWAAADKNKTSLFINNQFFDNVFKQFFPENPIPLNELGSWSVVDIDTEDQSIFLNGVLAQEETSSELTDVFQNIPAQKNRIAEITPTSSTGFYSFTYTGFEKFWENLNKFRKDSLKISPNHILNFTKEAGVIFQKENVFALTTTDPELAKDSFSEGGKISEFRGIEIFTNPEPEQFSKLLQPLVTEKDLKFYSFFEDYLIFAVSSEAIEGIISNFQNSTTLAKQQYYQDAVADLAGSSSLLMVSNNENAEKASSGKKEAIEMLNFKNYPITALQFVQDQNFTHLHGVLKMSGNQASEGIQQIASIKLNSELGILPQLVKNDDTNKLEIMIQGSDNILYLFNSNGELQWKKEYPTRITGEIFQVDLFKNGNYQYLFSTPNAVHVLDRNGKLVKPFPLEFKDEITQPVSVFDYDNNKNYRIVVTQKNNLLMYDSNGKMVRGFDPEKTESPILKSPKHIRLRNKDYIIFSEENGKLNILSRQGNSRITVKEKVAPSENAWYKHKGNFVSVDSAEQMIFVDENGKVEPQNNPAEADLKIAATEKILASISENILKINGKEINLDFGLYTAPKIFVLNGRTFITVTDTQAQRLLVFDDNAQLLPGFPVYGNSSAQMAVDKDNNILITVKGEENSVLVYKM